MGEPEHVSQIESRYDGAVERTAHVQENGFTVDRPLRDRDAAKCTSCASGPNGH
ncbi:hypothetical protein PWG71_23630 [Nocardiopsis sp. N85]|uniref:hypothetical protein n=1 Tax=Nocardiopsis sp. N85 TaxID=3029400 RepID=UPI00237FCAFF|nr:hypothetical protein [Nocardiopsis sp. N85]MDE3724394.1 hypothetical protein [Nocardiopsis sp. N85]